MSKNRIIPYGYKIQDGSLQKVENECETIIIIYEKYLKGNSYKTIAETLTKDEIIYHNDNYNWNKNMVARILKNEIYKGDEKYPQIISDDLFIKIQDSMKPYNKTQSENIKKIRQKFLCGDCGEKVKRRLKSSGVERWYCESDTTHVDSKLTDEMLLDKFIELLQQTLNINILYADADVNETTRIELTKLENDTLRDLSNPDVQKQEIELKLLEITQRKYDLIDDFTAEKEFILNKLKIYKESGDIDSIIEIIDYIYITETNIDKIQFKNGICCNYTVTKLLE